MKETRFIAQNKEKWSEAEKLLKDPVRDPEKLSKLFIQVVDDLSYSTTYYPNRSVRVYLNKIARQFFAIIYSHKKEKRNQFMSFWLDELPQVIHYCRREILISLFVFLGAVAIGVLSSAQDPQFVNTILGDSYVTMTNENIAKGDPMAVYKQSHEVDMFLGITFNNLMVAFRTYVLGIFLGIGTIGSLLANGIMVGSFQYYFIKQGLFLESASTIWLHGTLEISSIVLAGGAGLTLGRGLIFPGTYSRIQSLQISGIRSFKFMLGVAPVFILAAVIESFLTRYTDAPLFIKAFLIILSAAFIIGYFGVYPWLKSIEGYESPLKETRLQPSVFEPVNFSRIKKNSDVLKDTFQFYSRHNSKFMPVAIIASVIISLAHLFFAEEQSQAIIFNDTDWWKSLLSEIFSGFAISSPPFIFVNAVCTGIVFYSIMKLIDSESKKTKFTVELQSFLQILVITILIYTAVYFGLIGILFGIVSFGILTFTAYVQQAENSNLFNAFGRSWDLFSKHDNQGVSLQFIILLLSLSILVLLSTPLQYIHMSILRWNFVGDDVWTKSILQFLDLFTKFFLLYMIMPILAASYSYLYHSQVELFTAAGLKESIAKMGTRPSKSPKR
jgi:uncharacterized membrane protein SpoIIM required for sporulation